jgi:hypothetical protein
MFITFQSKNHIIIIIICLILLLIFNGLVKHINANNQENIVWNATLTITGASGKIDHINIG